MEKNTNSITRHNYGKNQFLDSLLYDYTYNNKPVNINYALFQTIIIAFLKENNETLTTLKVNNEFKQELYIFINELLATSNKDIKNNINKYNFINY